MPKSERLGIGVKDAMASLDMLLKQREAIQKEMAGFGDVKLGQGVPLRYVELGQQLQSVNERVVYVRDWYSLNVLESLHNETRILKYLTVV